MARRKKIKKERVSYKNLYEAQVIRTKECASCYEQALEEYNILRRQVANKANFALEALSEASKVSNSTQTNYYLIMAKNKLEELNG